MKHFRHSIFIFTTLLALGAPAFAVDGVTLINQATVQAAGGFPYVISQPGSYKLAGNLQVNGATAGISITAADVTLDLNGFSLTGTGGAAFGINSTGINTTVGNGTVSGFSTAGIYFQSPFAKADRLTVRNSVGGIVANADLSATNCTLAANGVGIDGQTALVLTNSKIIGNSSNGVEMNPNSTVMVSGTVFQSNGGYGAKLSHGTVTTSAFADNGSYPLAGGSLVYSQNTFVTPVGLAALVSGSAGPVSAGDNACRLSGSTTTTKC